jgi:hypothetical protein
MNIKFYKSCYDLAAFATCLKDGKPTLTIGDRVQERIEFTDNFFVVAQYKFLGSDYLSSFDYEVHSFSINFIRDDELVESINFEKKFDCKKVGSLADPRVNKEAKMEVIKECRPTKAEQFENMFKKTKLQSHEVAMVIAKNKKLFDELVAKQEIKNVKK